MMTAPATPARSGRLTCLSQNIAWTIRLNQTVTEIDQLLSLLTDVQQQPANSSVDEQATALIKNLNKLKIRIEQVRTIYLCNENACEGLNLPCPCYSRQFGQHKNLSGVFEALHYTFDRLRTECYRLVSGPAGAALC